MPINLYIVEDNTYVRQAFQLFFQRQHEWQTYGIATTAEEALADLTIYDADLVIVDVALPDMDGIQLIERLLTQQPALRCLIFSCYLELAYIQRFLEAGAKGYVVKDDSAELAAAIRHILNGEVYLSKAARREQSRQMAD